MLGNVDDTDTQQQANKYIGVPSTIDCLQGILTIIPMQLLSMHIAQLRGCDVRLVWTNDPQYISIDTCRLTRVPVLLCMLSFLYSCVCSLLLLFSVVWISSWQRHWWKPIKYGPRKNWEFQEKYHLHCFQISCWIMYYVKIRVVIGLLSSFAMGMWFWWNQFCPVCSA